MDDKCFWDRVAKKGEDECWLWLGAKDSDGYGNVYLGNNIYKKAHRVAYALVKEEIPLTLELDHLCRNPTCVNPKHLEAVTHRENILRGDTIPAKYAARTHCQFGHLFSIENTYYSSQGHRRCRLCMSARYYKLKATAKLRKEKALGTQTKA